LVMPPKASNAEVKVYEDVFHRATKIKEAGLKVVPAKGDLTEENLYMPLPMQSDKDFKAATTFFGNGGTVKYAERTTMKWPSDANQEEVKTMKKSASDFELIRKPKKEVQDMFKFMKKEVKTAEKIKKNYFK